MSENGRVMSFANPRLRPLPDLGHGEVQVFRLWATGDAAQSAFATSVLSPAERERAAHYRVERARDEFVVGRAALRVVLGAALGVEPGVVALRTDSYGKPIVDGIEFNVTHSRGLVYLAVCRGAPVGVDVEWIDPALEVMELAEPNFSAEETRLLLSVPAGAEQAAAFCRLWTLKEAVAKADGRGLGIALRDLTLPDRLPGMATVTGASAPNSVVTAQGLPLTEPGYWLNELEAPQGFAAALAVRDSNSPIVCRLFPLDLGSSGVSWGVARQ